MTLMFARREEPNMDSEFGFDEDFNLDADGDGDVDDEDVKKMFDPESIEVMIVTEGDDLVCEECAEWDGEVLTIGEVLEIFPIHPNCRCTIEYADEDDEEKLQWYEDIMSSWGGGGYNMGGLFGQALGMLAAGALLFVPALYSYGIKDSLSGGGRRKRSRRKRR